MKTKPKRPLTPAQLARRNTDAFLWHFRLTRLTPHLPEYSHVHWWLKAGESVPLEAAVWELMRRHPDSEDAHRKACDPKLKVVLDPVTEFVGCHCFETWCELSKWLQRGFVRAIWKQLTPRHGFLAPPVTVLNGHRPFQNYHRQLEATGQKTRLAESVEQLLLHVQTSALESHHAGQMLIAVDPNAPPARIAKGVASAVAYWRNGQKPMNTGKSRIGQWLDVVAKFEAAESSRPKQQIRDDQLFACYRRAIQDWPLPS